MDRRAPYGQPRACLHEMPPARRPQAYAVLRVHGRKRAPGVEPGAALMTARPRGGPASNQPRESAFPKLSASHRIEEGLLPMSLKLAPKSAKSGRKRAPGGRTRGCFP